MPLMREFCGPLILQALPGQNTIIKYNEIKLVHWRRLASPNRPLKVDCGRRSASDHHKCIIRRISKAFTTQWWEKVLSNNFPNVTIIGEMSATAQLCSSLSGWALSSAVWDQVHSVKRIFVRCRSPDWVWTFQVVCTPHSHGSLETSGVCNRNLKNDVVSIIPPQLCFRSFQKSAFWALRSG